MRGSTYIFEKLGESAALLAVVPEGSRDREILRRRVTLRRRILALVADRSISELQLHDVLAKEHYRSDEIANAISELTKVGLIELNEQIGWQITNLGWRFA